MRWLLLPLVALLGGCMSTIPEAEAGTALGGAWPWAVRRVALSSTTDWVAYDPDAWVAQALVVNAHATDDLYVGDPAETGTFVGATDQYVTLPPGAGIRIPLTQANGKLSPARLVINLASSTASHPVELVLSATTE